MDITVGVLALLCWSLISYTHGQITSSTFPAVQGTSVSFVCGVSRAGDIVWDKTDRTIVAVNSKFLNNYLNNSRFSLRVNSEGKQVLSIGSVKIEDDGTYRCYGLNNNTMKEEFILKILVHPSSIFTTTFTGQIDEGSTQSLSCFADKSKPPPTIEWILTGPNTNKTTMLGQEDLLPYADGTWRKNSNLTFIVTREMYRGSITCVINIPIFYNDSREVPLDVNLAPLTPNFGYFTGLFDDNTLQIITCESEGSRPPASVEFYLNRAKLQNTRQELFRRPDGTYLVVGRVSLRLIKQMEGDYLSCNLTNSVVKNRGQGDVSKSVELLATYAPRIATDNGTRQVMEGREIVLACMVDARPMPIPENIFWRRNGQVVIGGRFNTSHGINSDLRITNIQRTDIGNYVCQATNRVGTTSSQSLHLDVLYRPVCTRIGTLRYAVKMGGSVKLLCQAEGNPGNATVTWRYRTTNLPIKENAAGIVVNGRPRQFTSTIYFSVTSPQHYTEIECRAKNAIGVSSQPCLFSIVQPGPPDVPVNCSASTLSDSEVMVSCVPGYDDGSDQFFVLQVLGAITYETMANSTSADFVASYLQSGTNFSFRICATGEDFLTTLSCSDSVTATTNTGPSTGQQVSSAGSGPVAAYVLGSIFGFIALVVLVVLGVCFIKRRRKDEERVKTSWNESNFHKTSTKDKSNVVEVKETRYHISSDSNNRSSKGKQQTPAPLSKETYVIKNNADRHQGDVYRSTPRSAGTSTSYDNHAYVSDKNYYSCNPPLQSEEGFVINKEDFCKPYLNMNGDSVVFSTALQNPIVCHDLRDKDQRSRIGIKTNSVGGNNNNYPLRSAHASDNIDKVHLPYTVIRKNSSSSSDSVISHGTKSSPNMMSQRKNSSIEIEMIDLIDEERTDKDKEGNIDDHPSGSKAVHHEFRNSMIDVHEIPVFRERPRRISYNEAMYEGKGSSDQRYGQQDEELPRHRLMRSKSNSSNSTSSSEDEGRVSIQRSDEPIVVPISDILSNETLSQKDEIFGDSQTHEHKQSYNGSKYNFDLTNISSCSDDEGKVPYQRSVEPVDIVLPDIVFNQTENVGVLGQETYKEQHGKSSSSSSSEGGDQTSEWSSNELLEIAKEFDETISGHDAVQNRINKPHIYIGHNSSDKSSSSSEDGIQTSEQSFHEPLEINISDMATDQSYGQDDDVFIQSENSGYNEHDINSGCDIGGLTDINISRRSSSSSSSSSSSCSDDSKASFRSSHEAVDFSSVDPSGVSHTVQDAEFEIAIDGSNNETFVDFPTTDVEDTSVSKNNHNSYDNVSLDETSNVLYL